MGGAYGHTLGPGGSPDTHNQKTREHSHVLLPHTLRGSRGVLPREALWIEASRAPQHPALAARRAGLGSPQALTRATLVSQAFTGR